MQQSHELFFASSNQHKFQEAKKILNKFKINLKFFDTSLKEIQSDSTKEISQYKAKHAFEQLKKPVIVEDDSLEIDSLNGFPGPYSSYVFKTIGNEGILNLVHKNRDAKFHSTITFCNENILKSFDGIVMGSISETIREDSWGYDPIFIPQNNSKTFAELTNKNELSHRFKALENFADWYKPE